MTENSVQIILEKFDVINSRLDTIDSRFNLLDTSIDKRIDSLEISFNERVDSFEDRMNDKFVLLEARFINRLEKEIGNLAAATAKGFAEQEQKIDDLRYDLENKMNIGFSMVDHKISSFQEFYSSKGVFRLA